MAISSHAEQSTAASATARSASTSGLKLFLVLGALSALGPASMDIYLPGLPTLTREFATTESTAQLTVSLYLVGLGVGQLISGPLSDVRGRRSPLIAALCVYLCATALCAVAPSIAVLVPARLLQGMAASSGVVIGRAVVRDLFSGAEAARYLSKLVAIYGLAPMLAPLVGSQILRVTSWRGVFVVLIGLGSALLAVTVFALPETLPPERRRPSSVRATAGSLGGLLKHRRFVGYALALGFGTSAVVAYVSAAPFVIQDHFGKSAQVFGLLFAFNATAMLTGSQLNVVLLRRFTPRRLVIAAVLVMVLAGAILLAVALAGLGLAPFALGLVFLMLTWGFVPANAVALAAADHPDVAGSASALLGLAQFGTAALVAPLVGVGGASPVPMAIVIVALALASAAAVLQLAKPPVRPPIAVLGRR